ncbi:MAG: cation:proton antiporter [Peptostreptococcaceae bacterium]|nr:cation:proton antiporter [Peptostreptococcaceae bacterium]
MEVFLMQLFVFLTAAIIAVPIANKLGLGSVLGYLIAGIVIGPFGLSLVGQVEEVMTFTEFGIVMMLFLVGLELDPKLLWQMRIPILGVGGTQVILSSAVIGTVSLIFFPWQEALSIGLILSLSSTALVLHTLKEKGLMNTTSGRSIFSVLLFQDIAVIPMLALMPLLATMSVNDTSNAEHMIFDINALPGYLHLIVALLAVILIFFTGKFICTPVFRIIAMTKVREIFVAAAIALVIGASLLMDLVGLSEALGAFLAGVVLADSEYRHELESDLEPFKGLLLGIFFISIGASLNLTLIGDRILLIVGLTLGLIVLKGLVLVFTGFVFKMKGKELSLFTIALAQGGEFAFILFQFSRTNGILSNEIIEPLISAVAISMFIAPLLFKAYEKINANKQVEEKEEPISDGIEESGHKVILAGFGRLGTDIGRLLISSGIKPVIIDNDVANIEVLRKFGFKVYYGDITRNDLLKSAGADEAELLIITMSDIDTTIKIVELAKKHYPHLKIVANAADIEGQYKLIELGVSKIRRETFGTSLSMGGDALQALGIEPYQAYRMMRIFSKIDDEMISELFERFKESEESYIYTYQQHMENLEEIIALEMKFDVEGIDKAWTVYNPDK